MKHKLCALLSVLLMTFSYAVVANANLVTNGGFENGVISTATSGYTDKTGGGSSALLDEGTYAVGKKPSYYHPLFASFVPQEGNSMMIVNGSPSSGVVVWTTAVPVTPYTTYAFSAYAASWCPDAPANLDMGINSTLLGTLNLTSTTGQWDFFSKTWYSGDSYSATLTIYDRNTVRFGNDFALDNIQLNSVPVPQLNSVPAPVPIPAAIWLLGSGFLGLIGIRKWVTRK